MNLRKSNNGAIRYFWPKWMAAFLAFPVGGAIATIVGPVDTPVDGLLGGLLAGSVVGLVQWLALRSGRPLQSMWIALTAGGFSLGTALAVLLVGPATDTGSLFGRGLVVGLVVALLQTVALARTADRAWVWIVVNTAAMAVAWVVTAAVIGDSIEMRFVVFGASGALLFQFLTGLAWQQLRPLMPSTGVVAS